MLVLGAGTDYGLFLVFRVRENRRAGQASHDAVINALTKVGESITFSALTVIAALLSLLAASFQIYSNLGIPLAIGIGVMLLAGLTLLPALLAIFGKAAFWPSKPKPGTSSAGLWGNVATRVVKRPAVALLIGVIAFGALSIAVTGYKSAGFGGTISAPAGSDSAAGQNLLAKYFPSSSANPTNLVYKLSTPVWEDPAVIATATTQLQHSPLFTGVTGPLNPVGGAGFTPAEYTALHAALGSGPLPATAPAIPAAFAGKVTPTEWSAGVPGVPRDRAVRGPGGHHDPVPDRADGRAIRAVRPRSTRSRRCGRRRPRSAPRCTPPRTASAVRRPRSMTSARSPTATWRTSSRSRSSSSACCSRWSCGRWWPRST